MVARLLASFLLVTLVHECHADIPALMSGKGRKILFLGDSNTYAGGFIAYLEGYLRTRYPAEPWDLINLGLPSETLSGLSEPDHPYPRPDVHTRVDRALARIKPDVVFICYGMNDGIYYPFSADRLAKYKEGTEKLVAKIERAGAKAILMTPAPFDGTPVAKNLLPKDAPKFSWLKPYENYDAEVLRAYADYLLEWRKKDYIVIDAHAAVHRFLKTMRAKDPKYVISGDGIHPNPTGHAVIAFEILRELKAPTEVDRIAVRFAAGKAVEGKGEVSEVTQDSMKVRFFGKWPMPIDARWDRRFGEMDRLYDECNRFPLIVTGLPPGKYAIAAEKEIARATHEELAKGVSIAHFKLPLFADRDKFGAMIQARQKRMGLAWLTAIGHNRPDTPKGEPFDQAMAYDEKARRELHEFVNSRNKGDWQELRIRRVD